MFSEKLIELDCCECGIRFTLPESLYNRRVKDKRSFFCPHGHGQHFTGPSEADKLRAKIKELNEALDRQHQRYWESQEEKHALRKQLIEEGGTPLPHSVRFSWYLLQKGVYTVQAAKALTEEDLLEIRGIGPTRAEQILEMIRELPEEVPA